MYKPSGNETFNGLAGIPLSDAGDPKPSVQADEQHLVLTYCTIAGSRASVEFINATVHLFGAPNDETLSSHPLYEKGLRPYAVSEVANSGWIKELATANAVHRLHNPEKYKELRHYIFAFHDSTFECVAMGIKLAAD